MCVMNIYKLPKFNADLLMQTSLC